MSTKKDINLKLSFPENSFNLDRTSELGAREAGLTLLELMVVLAVSGMLLLIGASLTSSVLKPAHEANARIFASMDQDLGLRWLRPVFEGAGVMRIKEGGIRLVDCVDTLSLVESTATPAPLVLTSEGEHIQVGFTAYRTAGSASLTENNAVYVPNASVFQEGQIILLSTLDAHKRASIYRVVDVDVMKSLVLLTPNQSELPSSFNCKLRSAPDADKILNPNEAKKYLLSLIQFAKIQVVKDDKSDALHLQAVHWRRFSEDQSDIASFYIARNSRKFTIEQKYVAQTETKGRYSANLNLEFDVFDASGAWSSRKVEVSAGYSLTGIEIANEAALPLPPTVEFMDVTCSLNYITSYADYALKDTGATIPIHRISVMMTDEARVKGASPSLSLNIVPSEPGTLIRCWNYNKLIETSDFGVHSFQLEGDGTKYEPSFVLATNLKSSDPNMYFQPVYCYISNSAQALAVLKFVDVVSGVNRSVSCSPATLDALQSNWKYDGDVSKCSKAGEIKLGRLVSASNPNVAGPALRFKEDGCRWSGTSSKSCNIFEVLEDEPNAELLDVQLLPQEIVIEGGPVGNKVICL